MNCLLLRVVTFRPKVYFVLLQDGFGALRMIFTAPHYFRVLRPTASFSGLLVASGRLEFSLEEGTFTLKAGLKGGGCSPSSASGSEEPDYPASSQEQSEVITRLHQLHICQNSNDYVQGFAAYKDLRAFFKSSLHNPYAVFRTLLETYSSYTWTDPVWTIWTLEQIREVLGIAYLTLMGEGKVVTQETRERVEEVVKRVVKGKEEGKLGVYAKCLVEIITSGIWSLSNPLYPVDPDFPSQLLRTLQILQGHPHRISSALQFGHEFFRLSLFHRSLSLDLASEVAKTNPEGAEFLLTYLKQDLEVGWGLRYYAMVRVAGVMDWLEPMLQRKVVEGALPKTQGFMQMMGSREGEDAWRVRAGAFHAFVIISTQSSNEDLRDLANSTLQAAHSSESHPPLLSFMRDRLSIQKLSDPSTEVYIERPEPLVIGWESGVGRAVVGDLTGKEVIVYEKDLFTDSAGVVIVDSSRAIVAGGREHPRNAYEISLLTGEYCCLEKLLEGRWWHASTLGTPQEVWISGGRDRKEMLRSVEVYRDGKWEKVGDLSMPREYHNSAYMREALYVFGGSASEEISKSIEKISNGQSSFLPFDLPEPRLFPAFLFLSPSKLLLAGGKSDKEKKDVWEINILTSEIKVLPKLPTSCSFPCNASSIRNGYVYLLNCTDRELMEFDMIGQEWKIYSTN